jgi:predicted GIY-YIG superfamily endonuclease
VWYVYFLQLENGDIDVGSTHDLRERVATHGRGQVASTKANLPVKLRAYVAVETEIIARRLERYFRSGSGKAVAKKRFF